MDYKFFLSRLKNILFNPAREWEKIHTENKHVKIIRNSFLIPLLIIVSICAVIGSFIFINTELSVAYSLLIGIKTFVLLFSTVYGTAVIFKEITYPLDLGREFDISFRIIVYSITPFLLCLIFSSIFESLLFINIIGLYGLYIFWTGTEKLLSPPDYKKLPMVIATIISMVGIYILTSIILTMITEKIYFAFFA
jgi:hypothetical protein